MSDRTDALAQAILNKPSLQECSLQQVDYLAQQYPYFSPAQVLLLQKEPQGSDAYERQLQRTILHFSNPLQLQYWLEPAFFETEMPDTKLFQNPIPAQTAPEEAQVENQALPITETETIEAPPEAVWEAEPVQAEPVFETETQPAQPEITPAPEDPAPASPEAPAITFEPYHTVDYFASQGIKLSQQDVVNDKLGKQVKSFTEWLKTMKRLPETAITQNTDAAGERKVLNLAVHSLDPSDVVTESMAEVWLKQGNMQKAAEVYNKLSLRYPGKSAYFAAKIESLKQR